ncbi:MAG: alkaline phosphatase family protein [Thermoleophilaceae bacterium]
MRALLFVIAAVAAALAPAARAAAAPTLPPVRHVFVIVLENKTFGDTFGGPGLVNAPYLNNTLVPQGELLTRYYGIGHNSADNYLAMVAGQPPTPASKDDCPDPLKAVAPNAQPPYNIATTDGCDYPANFRTIADQLTEHGFTWKGYNQGIPAPCSLLKNNPAPGTNYARKHNPFVFFRSLRDSGQCQANDVGLDGLEADLQAEETTPNLVYIVPDECDDAHTDCTSPFRDSPLANPVIGDQYALQQGDAFVQKWAPKIIASPAFKKDGLLIVTFDESVGDATACCGEQPGPADPAPGGYADGIPGPGGGVTGTVLVSPFISPGAADPSGRHLNTTEYNHYSLLRSLEDLFGIDEHLGYAAPDGLVPFGADVFDRVPGAAPATATLAMLRERIGAPCAVQPRSAFEVVRLHGGLVVRGHSRGDCGGGVNVVQVAVARRDGSGCRWLTVAGREHRSGGCSDPFWLLARGDGSSWRLQLAHLPAGRYEVRARAVAPGGRSEPPRTRAVRVRPA